MKKFNINSFLKLSPEEQAKQIERDTKALISRLPTLKKQLQMYGEVSDELYNLSQDEIDLMGTTYAKAVRGGQITTPSSQRAYQDFIKNLNKYSQVDLNYLAQQTAKERLDSWLKHIEDASTDGDIAYAKEMLNSMTDEEKLGFTRSKFFMDSSYMYAVTEEDDVEYSIQTLKLELYLEEVRGKTFKHIYRTNIKGDNTKLRKYRKRRK